jgi:phage/plasmid-like protein (TIGR03299 family)
MPADIGEMFYTGETPWHGLGTSLDEPATVEEALKAGGLNWEVGQVNLMTADDPPSPVSKRRAIVRLDRPAGHEGRVLGVAHRGFAPVQNRDAALLFDAVFGHGRAVYHTGGYLGNGEVIWLLAKIDKHLEISKGDVVEPYALLANSHDGSMALNIRLTMVRVVCRNTLALAMQDKRFGEQFRRAHQGTLREHAEAAQQFFAAAIGELDGVAEAFTRLTKKTCSDQTFAGLLQALLPEPKRPKNAERNKGLLTAYDNRLRQIRAAREKITELRETGKGMELVGTRGTYWGALNAVLEYVDHYEKTKVAKIAYALIGDGMELKVKTFRLIQEMAAQAA